MVRLRCRNAALLGLLASSPVIEARGSPRKLNNDAVLAMAIRGGTTQDRNVGRSTAASVGSSAGGVSRRVFLPAAASVAAVAAGSFPSLFPASALADGPPIAGSSSSAAPLRPPPMAGGTAAVIPGLAAKLRPVVVDGGSGWILRPPLTELGRSRILASDLSPLNPSVSPVADKDVYYPPFLTGTWDVTAALRRKVYPYGTEFTPSQSLVEGSPRYRYESAGDSTQYEARYIPTDADPKKAKIIADREYNAVSISRAYKQVTPVQDVEWDPRKDPTRLTLSFGAGPLTEDMMPLGQRRAEIYITARRTDSSGAGAGPEGREAFCASERTRLVYLSPGNVLVSDTETTTEFRLVEQGDENGAGDRVKATQRVAVYLTPNPNSREGVMWEVVRGRAVAFFDYELDMKKRAV